MKYAAVTGSVASSEFARPLPEPEAGMTPNGILRATSQSGRASYAPVLVNSALRYMIMFMALVLTNPLTTSFTVPFPPA